ncbi:MAG: hypothetical protein OXH89_04365, partial [bacterium]|nr:hypothetical protein [bacterium]
QKVGNFSDRNWGISVIANNESAPPPADLTVVADRPFLWAIVHPETDALLFVGRLVDPTA